MFVTNSAKIQMKPGKYTCRTRIKYKNIETHHRYCPDHNSQPSRQHQSGSLHTAMLDIITDIEASL